jgi:ABC-2 type transport system ATP-binding protein
MQQKISIARALMINPPLLLLDSRHRLDPKAVVTCSRFSKICQAREGTTILLTTHDMAEAERLLRAHRFLRARKLVAEGTRHS